MLLRTATRCCWALSATHAYNQTIYKKRRYDAINDFTPVALFSEQPMVLENTQRHLRQHLARIHRYPEGRCQENAVRIGKVPARPRTWPAHSSTQRSEVSVYSRPLIAAQHRPANDLIGGQIDYSFVATSAPRRPLITGKQVKAMALLSRDRSPLDA